MAVTSSAIVGVSTASSASSAIGRGIAFIHRHFQCLLLLIQLLLKVLNVLFSILQSFLEVFRSFGNFVEALLEKNFAVSDAPISFLEGSCKLVDE
jgi:hypothetical protein